MNFILFGAMASLNKYSNEKIITQQYSDISKKFFWEAFKPGRVSIVKVIIEYIIIA
jgi:hypothetical protein